MADATNLVPSAEEATVSQSSSVLVDAQAVPELVEIKIIPLFGTREASATSSVPSVEKTMEFNAAFGALFDIHEVPEFVEIKSGEYPVIGE
jgi:hypothetical protein